MLFPRLTQNPPLYNKEELGGFDRDLPWPSQPAAIFVADLDLTQPIHTCDLQRLFHVCDYNHPQGVRYRVQVKKGTRGADVVNRRSYVTKTGPVAVGPRAVFFDSGIVYVAGVYALEGVRFKHDHAHWYPIGKVYGIDPFPLPDWDTIVTHAIDLVKQGMIE